MVLAETFGSTGTGVVLFGGAWWLMGLYLLLIMIAILLAYRVSAEAMSVFIIAALISIGYYQLFIINEQIVQTVLFIIFMFIGWIVYLWVSR